MIVLYLFSYRERARVWLRQIQCMTPGHVGPDFVESNGTRIYAREVTRADQLPDLPFPDILIEEQQFRAVGFEGEYKEWRRRAFERAILYSKPDPGFVMPPPVYRELPAIRSGTYHTIIIDELSEFKDTSKHASGVAAVARALKAVADSKTVKRVRTNWELKW